MSSRKADKITVENDDESCNADSDNNKMDHSSDEHENTANIQESMENDTESVRIYSSC